MNFKIVGDITDIETIVAGTSVRELPRLRKLYGKGRWRKLKGVALVRLHSGRIRKAELHWYEAHGMAKKKSSANDTSTSRKKLRPEPIFVVCVNNSEYPASLELHKIYCVLADTDAEQEGDLRIIDESGEDYLYPTEWFIPVDVPSKLKTSLLRTI